MPNNTIKTLDFESCTRPEIEVNYENNKYTLKKSTAGPISRFNDARLKSIQFNSDGSKRILDSGELPFILLESCLTLQKTNKSVANSVLKSWPSEMIDTLFEEAKILCNIDTDNDEQTLKKVEEVFNDHSSPVDFEVLKSWVNEESVKKELPESFLSFFQEVAEERAKN